jgi:tetratricopeptide (TPR) repeat protein
VTHRVGALGPIAVRAIEVAAVCGSDFSADFVNEVADLAAEDVIAALEAAVAASVLVDVPGSLDRYAFAQSLLRKAIYTGLPKTRRASLHRRIAETLAQRHGNDPRHVAELASHFAAGGAHVAPRALEYCVRAGASALGALAFDEAREHYERALKALDLTGSADASLRCELLIALGEAEWRSGDRIASRDTYARVLRIARRNGDSDMQARAALGFAGFGWVYAGSGDGTVAATLSAALEARPRSPALRARLNARLAEIVSMDGDRDAAMRLASRAVDQAREAGDEDARAQGLIAGWYAALGPSDLPHRRSLAAELGDVARAVHDRDVLTKAGVVRVLTTLELGDFAELDVAIAHHRRLADQTKQPTARLHSRALLSMRALMEGRLSEAEGHTAEVLEVGEMAGSPAALQTAAVQLLFLRWEQGRLAEMDRAVAELAEQSGSRLWGAAHAFVLAEQRQRSRARKQLADLAGAGFADAQRDSDWLGVMCLAASATYIVRDKDLAAEIVEELEPYAGRVVAIGRGAAYAGSASRYLGLLAVIGGDLDSAAVHLAEDIAISERAGALPWLARSRRDLATVLGKRGRSGDAEKAGRLLADSRAEMAASTVAPD